MAAQESITAKFLLITDGVHYPPKKPWLLVLPIAFPSTCSWTSHKMSFAVLPVSDCVSTPFALRPQHGAPPPPLPVICAKLMMMSRMNRQHAIFHCTHPIQCLFAGDMSPYSQRQEHRMFLLFAPEQQQTIFFPA